MKKTVIFLSLFFFVILSTGFAQSQGPVNQKVKTDVYKTVVYVAETGNDMSGNGTKENPWKTITNAVNKINAAESGNRAAILVAAGKYNEPTIVMKNFTDLFGGFNASTWERDIFKYMSVVTADSGKRAIIAADNCTIDGFSFRKNVYRGKGAAVYCKNGSPVISNNVFMYNKSLGPLNWHPKFMHELANDGGAVAFDECPSPKILNNVFYKNNTENGRGAGIAFNDRCGGEIKNNVFIKNITGLDDPMRSSDGGAVSIFNWCNPLIENNVFIGNESLASNDAGALFVALWCSPKIIKNVIVASKSGDDAGALFVGGQEHRYDSPLDPLPPKNKFFVEIDRNIFVGNSNPSLNSGVMRFTMESRGKFTNNICFNNSGVYFQRCEAEIYNNTMVENFILIETKEGLGKNTVANNIIWGSLDVDAPSEFYNNDMREKYSGSNNIQDDPLFLGDEMKMTPLSVSYDNTKYFTTLYVSGSNLKSNSLAGRIVKAGNSWGVVKSNDANNIVVWGDFTSELEFYFLPTLSLSGNSPCINKGIDAKSPDHDYFGKKRPAGSRVDIGAIEIK